MKIFPHDREPMILTGMTLTRRHMRALIAAGLGWIGIEFILFWLCVQSVGVFPTLLFLTVKGGLGIMVLATTLRSVFRAIAEGQFKRGVSHFGSALFVAAGALLILLPGFLSMLAGMALFSPSMRALFFQIIRKKRGKAGRNVIVALEKTEWQEVSVRKPRRRTLKSPTIAP